MTAEIQDSGGRLPLPAPASPTTASPTTASPTTTQAGRGLTFHSVLSAMNPLQYLPVVGTIYRAVTGDVIPEKLRLAGSMLVSGLMGGPVGLGINIATAIAEKVTGIDPEKIIASQLRSMPTLVPRDVAPQPATETPQQVAWTPAQLAAYGVRSDAAGVMTLGEVQGADVLNTLQLIRLNQAAAAYAANQTQPLSLAARG